MQVSRGSKRVSGAVMWLGRGCIIQKSIYQPILRHPIFHVTITETIWNPAGRVRACFLVLEIRVECVFSMNTYL